MFGFFDELAEFTGEVIGVGLGITAAGAAIALGITATMAQAAIDAGCTTYDEIREFCE